VRRDFEIVTPYAVGMVRVEDGKVTLCAPIFRWMHGKDWTSCREWIARKDYTVIPLPVVDQA
jgi:hypothetical protein